jgi:hypothetical protein
MARERAGFLGAMAQEVAVPSSGRVSACHGPPHVRRFAPGQRKRRRPGVGPPLDRVTRPTGLLVPSTRPAPDGPASGGRQPTDSRVINRRV